MIECFKPLRDLFKIGGKELISVSNGDELYSELINRKVNELSVDKHEVVFNKKKPTIRYVTSFTADASGVHIAWNKLQFQSDNSILSKEEKKLFSDCALKGAEEDLNDFLDTYAGRDSNNLAKQIHIINGPMRGMSKKQIQKVDNTTSFYPSKAPVARNS